MSKKKIALAIAAGLGVALLAFLGFVATRPDTYRVTRSKEIAAPADRVLPYLNDFQRWTEWSPWEELDPQMKKEFSAPPSGEGAWYTWHGNSDVGSGKMTIASASDTKVVYKLEFIEPFQSVADTTMELEAAGDRTRVTWSMEGQSSFITKLMGVFMDMDAMIGKDFEKGLDKLDRAVRAS